MDSYQKDLYTIISEEFHHFITGAKNIGVSLKSIEYRVQRAFLENKIKKFKRKRIKKKYEKRLRKLDEEWLKSYYGL